MGDSEEALERLKHEYPEIDESVLQETLRNNGYDLRRASDALRARFYSEDAGIPQEQPFWSSVVAPFNATSTGPSARGGGSDWTLSLESLQEGVTALGAQLVYGVEAVADTFGSLGDLIPDLIFGTDEYRMEDEAQAAARDKEQVVVGGSRGTAVKKRGMPGKPVDSPVMKTPQTDLASDEEGDDWTKED